MRNILTISRKKCSTPQTMISQIIALMSLPCRQQFAGLILPVEGKDNQGRRNEINHVLITLFYSNDLFPRLPQGMTGVG